MFSDIVACNILILNGESGLLHRITAWDQDCGNTIPTCPTCQVSLRTNKELNLLVLGQELHNSNYEEYPDYDMYIFLISHKKTYVVGTH